MMHLQTVGPPTDPETAPITDVPANEKDIETTHSLRQGPMAKMVGNT